MQQFLTTEHHAEILELKGLGTFKVVLVPPGSLHVFAADDKDRLDTTTWTDKGLVVSNNDIVSYDVASLDGEHLVVMYTTSYGNNMVALWPGEFSLYGPKDPYRLYYGLDTQTLYMNIENRWVPISYLEHDKLYGTGELSHEQLESAIVDALRRITDLENNPGTGGGSGGSGGDPGGDGGGTVTPPPTGDVNYNQLRCVTSLPTENNVDGDTLLYVVENKPLLSSFYNNNWYSTGLVKTAVKGFLTAEMISLFEHNGLAVDVVEDDTVSDFSSCVKLGHALASTTKTMEGTFICDACTLRVPWKVSSENSYEFGTVYIDGKQIIRVSGTSSGTTYFKVGAGEHQFKFTYEADGSGWSGENRFTIWGIEYNILIQ